MHNGKIVNVANPQHALQDMLANETGRIHQQAQSMTGSPNVEVLSICWAGVNLAFSSTVMDVNRVVDILAEVRQRIAPSSLIMPGFGG
jgi:hypothetical protein